MDGPCTVTHLPQAAAAAAHIIMALPSGALLEAADHGPTEQLRNYARGCRALAGDIERGLPVVGNAHRFAFAKALRECANRAETTIRTRAEAEAVARAFADSDAAVEEALS